MKPKIEQIFPEILTIEDIFKFEKKFNMCLPESYKKFLLENNGGSAEPDFYYISDEKCASSGSFHCLEEVESDLTDSFLKLPKNIIPISDAGGGNIICLSVSGDDIGKLYIWWCESAASEDEEADYSNLKFIADNFDEFINNFVDFDDIVPQSS